MDGSGRSRSRLPILATIGENPYFVLKPGYQLTLEGKESGKTVTLVVSVLDETKLVGGIETRVVEERESENGALVEISRNFMAIHKTTRDIYYLGEEVDIYKNGKIVDHEGAWLHGSKGATLGCWSGITRDWPAVLPGSRPGVAMDRARVVSVTERGTTPAGTFERCLKTEETTPLEPGDKEYKLYAPGVGLIQDGPLVLISRSQK